MAAAPDASPLLLGIECGGTRTVAIGARSLPDGSFDEGTRHESGPCNLRLVSDAELEARFRSIAEIFPNPAGIGVGMAGVRDLPDIHRVQSVLARVWQGTPAEVDHDLESALAAADLELPDSGRHRVILLSGTGSCCYGRSPSGRTAKVGGWGHLLGDRGSAYDVAHRALRAAAHHLDHSGVWTRFGQRALRLTEGNAPNDLIAWMQSASKTDVARLTPEVFAAADEGDPVARKVLTETVAILAEDAVACSRKLGSNRHGTDIVLAGSVVLRQPAFSRRIALAIRRQLPRSTTRPLTHESAWGAVVMARRAASRQPASHPAPDSSSSQTRASQTKPVQDPIPASRSLSPTEQSHPGSMNLDRLPVAKAIDLMLSEDARIPAVIAAHRAAITRLILRVERAFRSGGRLIYVGAGTSGRLGVLDASECPPTFKTPPESVQGIIAGGVHALHSAVEGAEDDSDAGAAALAARGIGPNDVVLGIAASGRTPFVWGALHEARRRKAFTALLCFNPHLQIRRKDPPDLLLALETGPEILTGSTRLKAGTATKLVLNLVTTLAMVRLGKVIGNLMVDLNPSNVKLRDRAARIVIELTGASRAEAEKAIAHSNGSVKDAVAALGRRRSSPRTR